MPIPNFKSSNNTKNELRFNVSGSHYILSEKTLRSVFFTRESFFVLENGDRKLQSDFLLFSVASCSEAKTCC